ncbi:putative fluoride ion transporter CrcB [Croceivirga lutea]|uniref:fluoride efflux transporter CrcB n=1 Tax=Croceivirga lutea TaxID=1775167 RepID=UPI00163B33C6|nr:fluoride efflux transporter CrcB [Croceivirga lutea]GGG50116.1 putative fluoride ion transporter CrcB [Croceivirga lutea]
MKQILLVFLGGGLGSVTRYLISKSLNPYLSNFFLGTFTVNIIGCFLIGLILGLSAKENLISSNTTLLLATGFCGGFTTFSTFAFEKHSLLKAGDLTNFAIYLALSVMVGIAAVAAGLYFSK